MQNLLGKDLSHLLFYLVVATYQQVASVMVAIDLHDPEHTLANMLAHLE
jgi:hypothetical protein